MLVAREALPQLPYSVDEIYGLKNTTRASSKYPAYSRVHTSVYRIFGPLAFDGVRPEVVIVEDSNSGYEFYRALCEKSGVRCVSAGGKSNIYSMVRESRENDILVIADGAAFGPEMAFFNIAYSLCYERMKMSPPWSFDFVTLQETLSPEV